MILNRYACGLGLALCLAAGAAKAQTENWNFGLPQSHLTGQASSTGAAEASSIQPATLNLNGTALVAWAGTGSSPFIRLANVGNVLSYSADLETVNKTTPRVTLPYQTSQNISLFEYKGDAYLAFVPLNAHKSVTLLRIEDPQTMSYTAVTTFNFSSSASVTGNIAPAVSQYGPDKLLIALVNVPNRNLFYSVATEGDQRLVVHLPVLHGAFQPFRPEPLLCRQRTR